MKKLALLIGVNVIVTDGAWAAPQAETPPVIKIGGEWRNWRGGACAWAMEKDLSGYCTRKGRWKEPLKNGYFNAYFSNGNKLVMAKVYDADLNTATGDDDDSSSEPDGDDEIEAAMQGPQ